VNALLSTLPALPERMTRLPVDGRGYPVPWFVSWLDESGRCVPRGQGTPDFRVVEADAVSDAIRFSLCWICGERMGAFKSFVIGPMCAVNRVSSEPPAHLECADFAARACPFLVKPHMNRRTAGLPSDVVAAAGCGLKRNPGVALVWTTKRVKVHVVRADRARGVGAGVLHRVGDPEHVRWYCEARPATRGEVLASIESGLPSLRELALQEAGGVEALDRMLVSAMRLVPREEAAS
jgi:hypothetical protein